MSGLKAGKNSQTDQVVLHASGNRVMDFFSLNTVVLKDLIWAAEEIRQVRKRGISVTATKPKQDQEIPRSENRG